MSRASKADRVTLAAAYQASKKIDETVAQQRQATANAEQTLAAATERLVRLVEQGEDRQEGAEPKSRPLVAVR